MKLRHTAAAPETLYIESVGDNFYKANFFQLNTYQCKLLMYGHWLRLLMLFLMPVTNYCQPRNWNYKKPFELLKSVVSTLIEGCSDLDSALIKDLGDKHTTGRNVVFQQKILDRLASRSYIYLYIFFITLFFKDYIQLAAVVAYNYVHSDVQDWCNYVYNYARHWYLNGDDMAATNDNNNDSGNNDGPSNRPGGNNNAGSPTKRRHKTETTTRRKHLPIGKKAAAKRQSPSSKAPSNVASTSKTPLSHTSSSRDPSSSKAPSSSNAPIINIDNAAIRQAERAHKEASDKFQASFIQVNLAKANLEQTFSQYQGLVYGLKRDYKPEPGIPLADLTAPSIDQYPASQKELAAKIQQISRLKGQSTDTFDAVTNQLRIAKIHTAELESEIQGYSFATRDPFVLLTKEALSRVSPVPEKPADIPSTSHPPVPGAASDSSSSLPGPSQGAAKRQFKTEDEAKELLRNMPRYETTFEDVGFDKVKTPYRIVSPPQEYNNYRFPPGEYVPSETPPPMQEQAPKSSRSKGKPPMRGAAGGSTRVA